MHKEDGEKESLTDNEQGAGKYQSVDKDGVSNGMQHNLHLRVPFFFRIHNVDHYMDGLIICLSALGL